MSLFGVLWVYLKKLLVGLNSFEKDNVSSGRQIILSRFLLANWQIFAQLLSNLYKDWHQLTLFGHSYNGLCHGLMEKWFGVIDIEIIVVKFGSCLALTLLKQSVNARNKKNVKIKYPSFLKGPKWWELQNKNIKPWLSEYSLLVKLWENISDTSSTGHF